MKPLNEMNPFELLKVIDDHLDKQTDKAMQLILEIRHVDKKIQEALK